MKDEHKLENSIVIKENERRGDKIIFDTLIKEKLAHVIVIKDNGDYHINLDGEDLGYYVKADDGTITRHTQPKGAHLDPEAYFKPIEAKIEELEAAGVQWIKQSPIEPKEEVVLPSTAPKDGLDNTGTQGYDSLTDDAFTGSSKKPAEHPGEYQSRTGSSSKDFHDGKDDL
ncbi:hypothetical protein EZ428_12825 [Pedobacter frigiditerrae]|uniref:Uncharacterized protein n=1 Tax=Pedobacter frigiditerrae TaxID=2530452 RepID=A0A4R0MW66_9SPHI|nr:hypothetical protein [Pedobacter frigiditerrae]TCC90164.1 hypothetical protein EZ428_12825 [Pedobacter frigiditerrae]